MGRVQVCLVVMALGTAARADDRTAIRLRPWVAPESDAGQPDVADGTEASIDIAAGGAFSGFATSPLLVETGEIGRYFSTSSQQAWSVEAVEKLDVVLDGTTPQLGMLAIGLRRLGRQHLAGIRAANFERISAGLALMSRGSNLVTGIGAELAGGTISFGGSGLGVHLDGYFFARPDMPGVDGIIAVSLGYVYATPARRPIDRPVAIAAPPPAPAAHAICDGDVEQIRTELVAHRKASAAACIEAREDASRIDTCNRESDLVIHLRTKLEACDAR